MLILGHSHEAARFATVRSLQTLAFGGEHSDKQVADGRGFPTLGTKRFGDGRT